MKSYDERGLSFLSNMYPCKIKYNGLIFNSSEHLYQWLKVDDNETWWKEKIRTAKHPKIAKKLANNPKCKLKKVKNVNEFLIENMKLCIYLKFMQNEELLKRLLNTPDDELSEYNYWNDKFWGISIKDGKGKDMLGKIYRLFKLKYNEKWRRK